MSLCCCNLVCNKYYFGRDWCFCSLFSKDVKFLGFLQSFGFNINTSCIICFYPTDLVVQLNHSPLAKITLIKHAFGKLCWIPLTTSTFDSCYTRKIKKSLTCTRTDEKKSLTHNEISKAQWLPWTTILFTITVRVQKMSTMKVLPELLHKCIINSSRKPQKALTFLSYGQSSWFKGTWQKSHLNMKLYLHISFKRNEASLMSPRRSNYKNMKNLFHNTGCKVKKIILIVYFFQSISSNTSLSLPLAVQ